MNMLPALHLLALRVTVLRPIQRLPHFHGPHWSALFRNLFNTLATECTFNTPTPFVWVQPVETGVLSYLEGDCISLGLVVEDSSASALEQALVRFNSISTGKGHFQPGVTIRLESALSRITGTPWSANDAPLSMADPEPEIDLLTRLDSFSVETLSPLRIPRPAGKKADDHRYCDAEFFLSGGHDAPLGRLLEKVRYVNPIIQPSSSLTGAPAITGGALTWLDVSYGDPKGKTVGGVAGVLEVAGRPDRATAERLVLGQYLGAGKNGAFGLGFYRIPQLDQVRRIRPLVRATTLFSRATAPGALSDAVARLADSSPGPDGMTLSDAKSAGFAFIQKVRDTAVSGPRTGKIALKHYALPKGSGGQRSVYAQNLDERILHRSFADSIGPSLDGILSSSAYAYRRGLSRKNAAAALKRLLAEGYSSGIKADITAFFDSVNTTELCRLLRGLFPGEPLVDHIQTWLTATTSQGIPGLPQGWALSPVLSNLYLDRFDRAMEQAGFRLVRFADDFVALFREGVTETDGIKAVEASLGRLGLTLKPEKTQTVVQGTALKFLGYIVSADEIRNAERPDEPPDEEWSPVFRPDWQHGFPVYLTSICRGAYSSGPHLIVKHADDSSDTIPWNRISRLVVVGRSPFSGGVVYRSVREQIPVTFIDIMGRTSGHLTASGQDTTDISAEQDKKCYDPEWTLDFARRLITAKIHNSFVLLRRNKVAAPEMKALENKAAHAENLESLRGFEGAAARIYFERFAGLTAPFEFKGRCYHPPDGPVNVMLSFGYTLLYNRLSSVLRDKGFNPRQGFFHAGRGTHCALASDLLEPLRHLSDRIVLSLIHLKEITSDDFNNQQIPGEGYCRMDGNGFRTFITRYENTMASRFTPVKGEKTSYNAWLDETTDALARSVRYGIPYEPLRID